jgi:DNA-directed RNA polymerase subunit beta'
MGFQEKVSDGQINPHDIMNILGPHELQKYIVDEVQKVYRLQGVSINDKHIEVIIRKMIKKVGIADGGDTDFMNGQIVDISVLAEENRRVIKKKGKPALEWPILLSITDVALSTDSWISAASSQDTTKVLTTAAMFGAIDKLRGLRENIIMGRLIPAGTGATWNKEMFVELDCEDNE